MTKKRSEKPFYFKGFETPNYTKTPNSLFDELLPMLSGAELKVLLYIIRRTFGWSKDADAISIKQLMEGIKTRDGKQTDLGTGLSRQGVVNGTQGLVEKGIIEVRKSVDDQGENEINVYSLRFVEEAVNLLDHRSQKSVHEVVNDLDPQKNDVQNKEENPYSVVEKSLKDVLEDSMSRATYDLHFRGLQVVGHSEQLLVVRAPSEAARAWLDGRLRGKLEKAARDALGHSVEVEVV